jgi:hypothetical protein
MGLTVYIQVRRKLGEPEVRRLTDEVIHGVRQLKEAVGTGTLGVDDTLGDTLTVKVSEEVDPGRGRLARRYRGVLRDSSYRWKSWSRRGPLEPTRCEALGFSTRGDV